jgi:hypothetical protein
MLSETTYKTIARTSAIYDLVVTSPFMTPWTLVLTLDVIHGLHTTLGLPGAVPTFGAIHLLFGGLLGSVVVVWSLARLHLNLAILGRYDALARFLFAAWQIFAVANGATPVVLIFTVFEIAFGVAQLLPYRTASRNEFIVSAPPAVAQ